MGSEILLDRSTYLDNKQKIDELVRYEENQRIGRVWQNQQIWYFKFPLYETINVIKLQPSINKDVLQYHQPKLISETKNENHIYYIESFATSSFGPLKLTPSQINVKPIKKYKRQEIALKHRSRFLNRLYEILGESRNFKNILDGSESIKCAESDSSEDIWLQPKRGFNDLPLKIMLRIFGMFSLKFRCLVLSQVCRLWNDICKHPTFWTELVFVGKKVHTEAIYRILKQSPCLERIKLESIPDIIQIIRQICRFNSSIKHIKIRNCSLESRYGTHMLHHLLTTCSQLISIDLKGTNFESKRFVEDVAMLPNLKTLKFGRNENLKAQDFLSISLNCRSLEELKIGQRPLETNSHNRLTDYKFSSVLQNLQSSLKSLAVDMHDLGPTTVQAVLKCKQLRSIGLINALSLRSNMFLQFKEFRYLTRLQITRACELVSSDFEQLFQHKNMKKLRELDISGCWRIGDSGVLAITQNLPLLQSLSLKNCKTVTSRSISYFQYCPKLSYINLAYLNIQSSSLEELFQYASNLKTIIISENMCKWSHLYIMKEQHPHVDIKMSISEYKKGEKFLEFLKTNNIHDEE